MTFGRVVAKARLKAGLKQEDLARQIKKEDGKPVSKAYLSEVERGTRNPPSDLIIEQLASALGMNPDVLYFHAGRLPSDVRDIQVSHELIVEAFRAFRKEIGDG